MPRDSGAALYSAAVFAASAAATDTAAALLAAAIATTGLAKPCSTTAELATGATTTAIERSSILDVFVKRAWTLRPQWVDVFVSGLASPAIFRQYPGAVGSLDAAAPDANGVAARTFDPSTRGWYTSTIGVPRLPSTTVGEYLPPRPMLATAPYLDSYGRGYMLSITAPIAGPDGSPVGSRDRRGD